jgi:uncharacterized protein (DUF58 family)
VSRVGDVLTVRGRAFVAAGLTLVLSGVALGFSDITRIGVLLTGLPLLAAFGMHRSAPSVTITRAVHPARLTVDQSAGVEIVLDNTSARRTPVQLVEERLDPVLGDAPRFVLPRMEPRERREVAYSIRSHVRGRHHLGPLALRVRDPFGLATAATVLPGTTEVTVLPRVEALGGGHPRGDGVGAEGAVPHMVALHGEDDVAIRTYRDGDDLRRIHWPATAHRGELMVRQEDRPARRRAVLVLDSRSSGHRGSGASGSFEWAVTAVASMAVHLTSQSYAVHLVSTETATDGRAGETIDVDTALDALAVAETSAPQQIEQVLHAAHPLTSAGGLVIAVMTDHDEDTLRRVASLRQPGGTGLLLLVEAATYAGVPPPSSDTRAEALARVVSSAGWSAAVVRSGADIGTVWDALTAYSGISMAVAT